MSEVTTMPTPATQAPVATPASAAPKSAIQLIEEQVVAFVKQREQAIANVHAIEGALQGAQHLLALLKNEAAKVEAETKKLIGEAETELKKL